MNIVGLGFEDVFLHARSYWWSGPYFGAIPFDREEQAVVPSSSANAGSNFANSMSPQRENFLVSCWGTDRVGPSVLTLAS
jgi:hypothetical protein